MTKGRNGLNTCINAYIMYAKMVFFVKKQKNHKNVYKCYV